MRTPAIFASFALLGCGRIGFDGTHSDRGTPQPPAITAGIDFAFTVRDRAIWCWGDDHRGQLGDNRTTPEARPVQVVGISDAISVVAGEAHACALRAAGGVSCWGRNE